MEVYDELGHGFLEAVCQEALAIEFELRGIPFVREENLSIKHSGRQLGTNYRSGFIIFDKIILEVKAADGLTLKDSSQAINCLNATVFRSGILVNFGVHDGL